MQRKLIKQGIGGYTIYLPKKWIEKKGLKNGDFINITENDTSLIIGSPIIQKKEITITLTQENKGDIYNIITHLYRNGFDRIVFTNTDEQIAKQLKDISNTLLLGFEISEKNAERIVLENISEPSQEKYDVLLRRVFLIVKETFNIIEEDFNTGTFTRFKEVEELRNQQFKFVLFCKRILIKEKLAQDPVIGWELLTFLTHIQHSMYYFYEYAEQNHPSKDEKIEELVNAYKEYYQLFYDAYFKKDITLIHKINSWKRDYQFGKCVSYLEASKGKKNVVFSNIKELFRLTQVSTSPIMSILLSAELQEQQLEEKKT